jgi:hypothetical protein
VNAPQRAYETAAGMADKLLAHGLPVLGFDEYDFGSKIALRLQLNDGSRRALTFPVDASLEEVEAAVRHEIAHWRGGASVVRTRGCSDG